MIVAQSGREFSMRVPVELVLILVFAVFKADAWKLLISEIGEYTLEDASYHLQDASRRHGYQALQHLQLEFDVAAYRIEVTSEAGELDQALTVLLPRVLAEQRSLKTLLFFREGIAASAMKIRTHGRADSSTDLSSVESLRSLVPFFWGSAGNAVLLLERLSEDDKMLSTMFRSAEHDFSIDTHALAVNPALHFDVHDVLHILRILTDALKGKSMDISLNGDLIIGGYGELGGTLALSAQQAFEAYPTDGFYLKLSFPMDSSFSDPAGFLPNPNELELREAPLVEENSTNLDDDVCAPWIPLASVQLCAGSDDHVGAARALRQFTAVGGDVHRSIIPANSLAEQEVLCLLSASEHINADHAKTRRLDNAVREVTITPFVLAVPAFVVGWAVFFAFWGLYVRIRQKRKSQQGKEYTSLPFRGPVYWWIRFLVNYPAIPLVVALAFNITLGILALEKSNWGIEVDMDFASYVREESDIRYLEDAFSSAQYMQLSSFARNFKWVERRLQRGPRLFAKQTSPYWNLDIYYTAVDENAGVFTPEALAEIKDFEDKMRAFQGFSDYCLRDENSRVCKKPSSVISLMYEDNRLTSDIDAELSNMLQSGILWFFDKDFSPSNRVSKYTRSTFTGGVPMKSNRPWNYKWGETQEKHEAWIKALYDEYFSKVNEEKPYKHIIVSWYEERWLSSYETMDILGHDSLWAIGSVSLVVVVLGLQVKSVMITLICLLSVLLSFGCTYYFYRVVLGYVQMTLLNFISCFLVIGIAVDDVLVLSGSYKYAASIWKKGRDNTPQMRMRWAYREAASAMLVTSVTTSGSFFSLCLSSVPVVRSFGWFMGVIVVCVYFNVMTIVPSSMLLFEILWLKLKTKFCPDRIPRRYRDDNRRNSLTDVLQAAYQDDKNAISGDRFPISPISPSSESHSSSSRPNLGRLNLPPPSCAADDTNSIESSRCASQDSPLPTPREDESRKSSKNKSSHGTEQYPEFHSEDTSQLTVGGSCDVLAVGNHQSIDTMESNRQSNDTMDAPAVETLRRKRSAGIKRNFEKTISGLFITFKGSESTTDTNQRARWDRMATMEKIRSGDATAEVSSLTRGGKCCGVRFVPFLYAGRFVLIPLMFGLAATFVILGMLGFKQGSGELQIFRETRNLGRIEVLRNEVFEASEQAGLDEAIASYNPGSLNGGPRVCPGSSPTVNIYCSSHGTCRNTDYTCLCDPGYTGADCSVLASGATPTCTGCNNGTCNSQGTCDCNPGNYGESCAAYCPGSPPCHGRGSCSMTSNRCECEETFSGPDCSIRQCPACKNGAVCIPGTQTIDADWRCNCSSGYYGLTCDKKWCPGNCSSAGECNKDTGVCNCYRDHEGVDCSIYVGYRYSEPLTNVVGINLVWGIKTYDTKNTSRPIFDKSFDWAKPSAQAAILRVIDTARNDSSLRVRKDHLTFPEAFREFVLELGLPYPLPEQILRDDVFKVPWLRALVLVRRRLQIPNPASLNASADRMAISTIMPFLIEYFFREPRNTQYTPQLGTQGGRFSGRVFMIAADIKLDVKTDTAAQDLEPLYNLWDAFVQQTMSSGGLPSTAQMLIMVSKAWTQMVTELNMINSTMLSFATSIGFTTVVVFLFTGNLLLAIYTTITICLTVGTLFGVLMQVIGWEFGAIEAVGVIFFVGLSVDYCLHINHSYNMALPDSRKQKVAETLEQLGMAILGGAVTTVGCAIFLWPCYIYLFVQLGVMIFANMLLALLYAFFFLCPLLMVAGPTGHFCSFYACCTKHSRKERVYLRAKQQQFESMPSDSFDTGMGVFSSPREMLPIDEALGPGRN